MLKTKNNTNWKLFRTLLGLGIFGVLAVFPLIITQQRETLSQLPLPLPMVLTISLFQSGLLLAMAIFLGLMLGKKVGLGAPIFENWLDHQPIREKIKSIGIISTKLGAIAGLLILILDFVFSQFMEPITAASTPLWQGFLGSFYGGIVEEILLRLFLVTLIAWIIQKFSKNKNQKPSPKSMWVAIVISATIFGLGHLPATALLTTITPIVIMRALVLNGIGGVIFGWLFWKKGIASAMIAHFTTDIVLLVVFPLVLILF